MTSINESGSRDQYETERETNKNYDKTHSKHHGAVNENELNLSCTLSFI